MSSISRSTSSAVLSGSSGLCVSVLLDKIKACMSKSVATASSSLLKSSSSGLQQRKRKRSNLRTFNNLGMCFKKRQKYFCLFYCTKGSKGTFKNRKIVYLSFEIGASFKLSEGMCIFLA